MSQSASPPLPSVAANIDTLLQQLAAKAAKCLKKPVGGHGESSSGGSTPTSSAEGGA